MGVYLNKIERTVENTMFIKLVDFNRKLCININLNYNVSYSKISRAYPLMGWIVEITS